MWVAHADGFCIQKTMRGQACGLYCGIASKYNVRTGMWVVLRHCIQVQCEDRHVGGIAALNSSTIQGQACGRHMQTGFCMQGKALGWHCGIASSTIQGHSCGWYCGIALKYRHVCGIVALHPRTMRGQACGRHCGIALKYDARTGMWLALRHSSTSMWVVLRTTEATHCRQAADWRQLQRHT